MKISYNLLKRHLTLKSNPEELSELLTRLGLEVTSITTHSALDEKLVLGEVLSCDKHPNADRLKKALVDIGGEAPIPIVCGAPNLESGQKVIVAPPGSTLKPLNGEIVRITSCKIRGVLSQGMICSDSEIGIGSEANSILVLETTRPPGTLAQNYFQLLPDYIFEIDITPNRGDACSHLGVARDILAVTTGELKIFSSPPLISTGEELPMDVVVRCPSLCQRYSGIVLDNINILQSSISLKDRMASFGMHSINQIVDILNIEMCSFGQPFHAFDYDKIVGKKLFIEELKSATKMTTLDGRVVELQVGDLTISDAQGPLALAGIIGGKRASISEDTKRIFIESAYFKPSSITKSARRYGLHTEASFRYERNIDIEFCYTALQHLVNRLLKNKKIRVASHPIDIYQKKVNLPTILLTYKYISSLIGIEIEPEKIKKILESLKMIIHADDELGLSVSPPSYRRDIIQAADLVEEIIRVYGYHNIDPKTTSYKLPSQNNTNQSISKDRINKICSLLTTNGFFQVITNSLISKKDLKRDEKNIVQIVNPLSQMLDIMRPTLLYSMVDVIGYNIARSQKSISLFELGRIYHKESSIEPYREKEVLAIAITGQHSPKHWSQKEQSYSLSQLYGMVLKLLKYSNIGYVTPSPLYNKGHYKQSIEIDCRIKDKVYKIKLGEISSDILIDKGIEKPVFYTEIPTELFFEQPQRVYYKPYSKTPPASRDISLEIDKSISFSSIEDVIQKISIPCEIAIEVIDRYSGVQLDKSKKSYTLRILMQSKKTMGEKLINSIVDKISKKLKKELGAQAR